MSTSPPTSAVSQQPAGYLEQWEKADTEEDDAVNAWLRLSKAEIAGGHWRAARFHLGAYIDAMRALRTACVPSPSSRPIA